MKTMRTKIGLLILGIIFLFSYCNKENDMHYVDFYDINERVGYWINSEREDTLYFINDKELIRHFNGTEEFLYSACPKTQFLRYACQ